MNRRVDAQQPDSLALGELEAHYRRDGFAFPYRTLPEAEAVGMAREVEALIEADSSALHHMRSHPHLVFPAVDRLAHDERVLDAVERLLGPDLLLWNTSYFLKPPRSADHVSWHQDLTYWGLSGTDQVSAWVALGPITIANGCMRFLPGSHRRPIESHRDTFSADNQLTRGQTLDVEIDEAQAVPVTLRSGEMSLHHGHLFHASGPNATDEWRIGITMIYLAPSMRQVVAKTDYARLVRGEDRFDHFECPPRPRFDFDPAGITASETAAKAASEALYRGADQRPESGLYVQGA
jgi:hypothetical protein